MDNDRSVAKRLKTSDNDSSLGSAMKSDDIINIVKDIITTSSMLMSVQKSKDILSVKYPEFSKAFPILFAAACEPNFDMKRFLYMINMRDKITNKTTSFEDASKEVGQALFDEYVKPIVNSD